MSTWVVSVNWPLTAARRPLLDLPTSEGWKAELTLLVCRDLQTQNCGLWDFKLLGINFDASLSWITHINIIISKASKWLYCLKQLRRSVICPVLEYASPVWHYSITHAQSEQLESIKKWAIHIIFIFSRGMSYPNPLVVSNLNSLKDRHDKLSRSFFRNMCNPASCLHHFLTPPRNTSVTSRLRYTTLLFRPTSRTKKLQSFVDFAFNKYKSRTPVPYLL